MKRFVQTVIVLLALPIMFPLVTVQAQEVTVDGMKYVIFQGHAVLAECQKEDVGDLVIPETVFCNGIEYPVTSIGGQVEEEKPNWWEWPLPFKNCSTITSVVIPNSVKNIGYWAFYCCENLKSIVFPDSVEIYQYAFCGCTSLHKILIPKGTTFFLYPPFASCNIDTLEYEAGRKTIDERHFDYCNVGTIIVPATVHTIVNNWLFNMYSLDNLFIYNITPPAYNITPFYNNREYFQLGLDWENLERAAMKANLIVPDEALEAYKRDKDWGLYEKIYPLSYLPTSMSHLQTDPPSQQSHPQRLYDLSGRRLSVPSTSSVGSVLPKGVYIENGKKRVRK